MKSYSKHILATSCLLTYLLTGCQSPSSHSEMDTFIDNLMSQMTIEEKIGQLNQIVGGTIVTGSPQEVQADSLFRLGQIGSILNAKGGERVFEMQKKAVETSRLGIPLLVGMDVIHGYETIFPIPLGLSCTWDLEGIQQAARIAAQEASANGVNWTFSPMVDICVDPRWGRQSEGNGEDPYLGSLIGQAMVRGYQGDDAYHYTTDEIMACIKHFALYGAAEAGRDYNTVDMSHLRMYNQYFPPYKACVEAGAATVMTSFNIVDGIPATANKWLLDDVLRKEWGFCGMVVTDYASIEEMEQHGMGDRQHNAALALKAGTDMDMVSGSFVATLKQSIEEGLVSQKEVDQACRRVLEAKYKLGLFDDPYRYCNLERWKNSTYLPEYRKHAKKMTTESFVLLKNNQNLLPLEKKGTVALIGPLSDAASMMPGCWAPAADKSKYTSLKQGMEKALEGKAKLLCCQGCNISDLEDEQYIVYGPHRAPVMPIVDDRQALDEALRIAKQADVIICAMGESAFMNGEAKSRAHIELPASQHRLLEALSKLNKPMVLVNFSGRATILNWESEHIPAILQVWYGSEMADALPEVLFGEVAPQGRLTCSMPRAEGQLPLYYNHLNTGRPFPDDAEQYASYLSNYLDVKNTPLYPFGYGLTYTTLEYGPLQLSSNTLAMNGEVKATIQVSNTGQRDAVETVQLYIHDVAASVSRPVKELKAFRQVTIPASQTCEVEIPVTPDMLYFYNAELKHVVEPGDFEIMVGPNSRDTQSQTLTLIDK